MRPATMQLVLAGSLAREAAHHQTALVIALLAFMCVVAFGDIWLADRRETRARERKVA